jgi:lambda family phage portal protein
MFSFLKSFSRRVQKVVRLKYDSARTTRDNASHWAYADDLSANASMTPEVRKIIRNRARYEVANNSYGSGLVSTVAEFCIGTGPRLQLLTDNKEYNQIVETEFSAWAESINLGEKLLTMRRAKCVDGEAFAVIIRNPKVNHEVEIDLRLIECDRVTTLLPLSMTESMVDGIQYDSYGNPAAYEVLNEHPGDLLSKALVDSKMIPADFMLHWYKKTRAEQSRGISELTPALPLFAQLRQYTLAVLAAAETAADLSVLLKTPSIGNDDEITPFSSVPIEKRMMVTLPEGVDAVQLKAEQPTTTYAMFKREILCEIGRCLQVPANIILGDSSGYNYASGRLDHQTFFKNIRNEQSYCEKKVLFPILEVWYWEAVRTGVIDVFPGADLLTKKRIISSRFAKFYWDGVEHVDPLKEANASIARKESYLSNLMIECSKIGLDWEDVLIQKAREKKRMEELGLTDADFSNGGYEDDHSDPDK